MNCYFILLFNLLIFCSCVNFDTRNEKKNPKRSHWYYEQYTSLSQDIFNSNKNIVKIPRAYQNYLNNLINKFNTFSDKANTKIVLFKSTDPFYCSLPSGEIFLSSTLINNYIIDENKLISVLIFEKLKIKYKVFRKIDFIPISSFDINEIIKFNQIGLKITVEMNKLIYESMLANKIDPSVYLRWIQLKNKNVLHFSRMYPILNFPFKEEFFYKSYIIKRKVTFSLQNSRLKNSSKTFYKFIDWAKNI